MSGATSGIEIAVIGMAGRYPGAKNLDQFWQNLCEGVESIKFFTDEELLVVVTRSETGELTPWAPFATAEVLADTLNGWVDNTVWNAPKSL